MVLQVWETVKEAITAYTGLSPAAFFTVLALAFAVYQVVSGFFVSPEVHQPRSTEVHQQSEPLPPPIQLGEITEEELKQYDGSDSKKPLLMAIKGQIYDVSQSRDLLLKWLYTASLMSKSSEVHAISFEQLFTDDDFKIINEVAMKIHPSHLNENIFINKNAELQRCLLSYESWKTSHRDLKQNICALLSSDYMTAKEEPQPVYESTVIGGFIDHENCEIPTSVDYEKIGANFIKSLRNMGLRGELDFFAIGHEKTLNRAYGSTSNISYLDIRTSLIAQHIQHIHVENETSDRNLKDTGDKRMISDVINWAHKYLRENHEPTTIVIATGDVDFAGTIEYLKIHLGFRVILAYPDRPVARRLLESPSAAVRWDLLASGNVAHFRKKW